MVCLLLQLRWCLIMLPLDDIARTAQPSVTKLEGQLGHFRGHHSQNDWVGGNTFYFGSNCYTSVKDLVVQFVVLYNIIDDCADATIWFGLFTGHHLEQSWNWLLQGRVRSSFSLMITPRPNFGWRGFVITSAVHPVCLFKSCPGQYS